MLYFGTDGKFNNFGKDENVIHSEKTNNAFIKKRKMYIQKIRKML